MLAVRDEHAELREDVAGQGAERGPLGVVEVQAGAGDLAGVVPERTLWPSLRTIVPSVSVTSRSRNRVPWR